jgi:DNA polymerase
MYYVDFETKSNFDLKVGGAYNYAQDASTEVLCMCYAKDDGEVQTWTHGPLPDFTGHQIRAWNASFERLIFWYVLQKNYPLEQFYCCAAQSRANCAPGSLEDAGRFAGASMRKDHRGAHLVRMCCTPPFNTVLLPELYEYCAQDVRAMRAISQSQRQLSDQELADYHVNERINDRGVLIDVPLAQSAVKYAAAELAEVQALVLDITKGEVPTVRSPKMRQWVQDRVGPEALKLMWTGEKYSIDKTVRANLLECDDVPDDVKDVIQCASDIWASSVAKFKKMADLADVEDGRLRGAFVFAGGAATGRFASYGAQLHNLGRKCAKDAPEVRSAMLRGDKLDNVSATLKSMLRPALIPEKVFTMLDWSGIEARVNPWMSTYGEDKLDLFRRGEDVYVTNAAATFRVSQVTPDQRTIGKVQELACGFAGGVGAFASMGRLYGINMIESEAQRMVDGWRRANQWAVRYWQDLEGAYTRAMRHKGHEFKAGRVTYMFDGQHLWYALPSGRVLCYPFAKMSDGEISYAKCTWKPAATAKEWPRARLWRGLACENITQAVANDLLRHSLRQIKDVVLHCHDEILCEGDQIEEMRRIMCTPPEWCPDLPLAVDGKLMNWYTK